jgi:hypothetical protein
MDWIKRNLYFLIGSLVALALMGLAGWYLYSKWATNNRILGELDAQYAELKRLSAQNPHPGSGKVDNIQAAKDQQKELRAWIQKACQHFQRIAPIPLPETGKVTPQEFTYALSRTIDQLTREAASANVTLPPKNSTTGQTYSFSFEEQRPKLNFAAGSLEPMSVQLGEIKAICDVLFHAKINALDELRRERVSEDDQRGPQTDYIFGTSVTNELAVLAPYEITFRGFSSELASVLAGFASSPYSLIVKSVNVEAAPVVTPTAEQPGTVTYTPQPIVPNYTPPPPRAPMMEPDRMAGDRYADRYGIRDRRPPPPQAYVPPVYTGPAVAAPKTKGGLPTVLDERQLKITMAIDVVKLTCPK